MNTKTKVKKTRKPGGGRRTLIQGVEMVTAVITITQAQKDYLDSQGNGNKSDGARKVITRDMARELEGKNGT
jgi:hypothetical protein